MFYKSYHWQILSWVCAEILRQLLIEIIHIIHINLEEVVTLVGIVL